MLPLGFSTKGCIHPGSLPVEQHVLRLGFWTENYQQTHWQNSWTVFYWAW
jgi:hypothetical protein